MIALKHYRLYSSKTVFFCWISSKRSDYSIKPVDKINIEFYSGKIFQKQFIFFDFLNVLVLTLRQFLFLFSYRERLRDWPIEALTTYFIMDVPIMKKGANSISAPGGADKSDQKLITLKRLILSKLFRYCRKGFFIYRNWSNPADCRLHTPSFLEKIILNKTGIISECSGVWKYGPDNPGNHPVYLNIIVWI